MNRQPLFLMLLVAALLVVTGSVFAQSQPYEGDGYTITPPEGWEPVSGELDERELEKLPETVRQNYDPNTTDVMFMNLTTETGAEGFKDNINIVVLDDQIKLDEDLTRKLEEILTDQYADLFESFEKVSFETRQFNSLDSVHLQASYKLLGYDLYLYQALIPGEEKAIVATCTVEVARKEEALAECEKAFESIAFATGGAAETDGGGGADGGGGE